MKNIYYILAAVVPVIALSCSRISGLEAEVDSLESRMTAVETQINAVNDNVRTLVALFGGSTVNTVTRTEDGYELLMSNGETVVLENGTDGEGITPVVGVDEEGYWTVDYQNGEGLVSLLDSEGRKVKATGIDAVTPVFGVDKDNNWTVDCGDGPKNVTDARGQNVPATATASASNPFIASMQYDEASGTLTVVLRDADNTEVVLPVVPEFLFSITGAGEAQVFEDGETKRFPVGQTGVGTTILSCPDGWTAELTGEELSVTAPVRTKALADTRSDISVIAFCSFGSYVTIAKLSVSLSDTEPNPGYANAYEAWQDGEDLTIGGTVCNRAVYGDGVLLTAENNRITKEGVYFVPSDVEAVYAFTGDVRKGLIIYGMDPEKRSMMKHEANPVRLYNDGSEGQLLAFHNMSITDEISQRSFALNNSDGGAFDKVIYDDCYLDFPKGFSYSAADAAKNDVRTINTFLIVDSKVVAYAAGDIIQMKGGQHFPYIGIRNTLIWSGSEAIVSDYRGIFLQANAAGSTAGEIEFTDNTMVNVIPTDGLFRIKGCRKAVIQNNILYLDGQVGAYKSIYTAHGAVDYNGYPSERQVSGNFGVIMSEGELGSAPVGSYKVFNNDSYSNAAFAAGSGTNETMTTIRGVSSHPFSEKDYASGYFPVRTGQSYSGAGAAANSK